MKKLYFFFIQIRTLLLSLVLLASVKMFGVGWTPTDAGLVVDLEPGDEIMLSVMVGETEYFVSHYPSEPGDRWSYSAGDFLKLLKQSESATEPSKTTVWKIDTALTRVIGGTNYALGGISYTMYSWIDSTLITTTNDFSFMGRLGNADKGVANQPSLCDVIFVIPTNQATTNMDPNNTLKRKVGDQWAFDGQMGTSKWGTYREVYWFERPRANNDNTYTNAALISFNTSLSQWSYQNKTNKGMATWIYADSKYNTTPRTLFRLYIRKGHRVFDDCSGKYFFAHDEQFNTKYRKSNTMSDSTGVKTIYTVDHMHPMERIGSTEFYRTPELYQIPQSNRTFFYVGYNNQYRDAGDLWSLGSGTAVSEFDSICHLRVRALAGESTPFIAPAGASGRLVVNTTSSAANLGVTFEPAGYFLRTNSGLSIEMHSGVDALGRTYWQTEQAWTITAGIAKEFQLKATLYTGAEFSETDAGADIRGWSTMYSAGDVPLLVPIEGIDTIPYGTTGWARIYPGDSSPNGGIVFVAADNTKYIVYHNNGHFGEDIPDQHAATGENTLIVKSPRLLDGYDFAGWNTAADGSGTSYAANSTIDMSTLPVVDGKRVLHLYAQATYTGEINVAISFLKEDGKRYFLMQPGGAPRYSRARHFDDWTNVWQGMGDINNTDPKYISTFQIIGKPTCIECEPYEYVLDPRRHTMRGATDSLVFYEDFQPENNEYLGLYYDEPYTVLSNNTWAGLFQSSEGWPTPADPCIDSTRIASAYYLTNLGAGIGNFSRVQRPHAPASVADTVIYYNAAGNYFGDTISAKGTDFMISGVGVVDAHYVILPDTTDDRYPWVDEITFDYHVDQQTEQSVWSRLIGKQLLAQMTVGNKIIYFHPNPAKTMNTPNELRLSLDYRMTESFTLIRDTRGNASDVDDRPTIRDIGNDFGKIVTSSLSSPMNVHAGGVYFDLCDTLRVRLNPGSTSKIKEYYGRWKTGAPGLHVAADGSRYRDILIRTKTYHYGNLDSTMVLVPANDAYHFSPLRDQITPLTFRLQKVVFRWLMDSEGNQIRKDVVSTTDMTAAHLRLVASDCSFVNNTDFSIKSAADSIVTIATVHDNSTPGNNVDTLKISKELTIGGINYTVLASVPLIQPPLEGNELIWSVWDATAKKRYFIMAGSGGLIFREFQIITRETQFQKSIYSGAEKKLLKLGKTTPSRDDTELKKGSKNAANNDNQYITPWTFTYIDQDKQQLTLKTEYGVDKNLIMAASGDSATLGDRDTTVFTYRYAKVDVNSNENFEEQVRIKYGPNMWLKYVNTAGTKRLVLQADSATATVFSWGYFVTEYNIHQKNTYPEFSSLEFARGESDPKTVRTRYKTFREYSMLIDNTMYYLCKLNEENIDNLINPDKEWKTAYTDSIIPDRRPFDSPASSGLRKSRIITKNEFTTEIAVDGESPLNVKLNGTPVNIVDTLDFRITFQPGAPAYRFQDEWKTFKTIEDAHLKIPLIRKTYYTVDYDSLVCVVLGDEHNYTFPSYITEDVNDTHEFEFELEQHTGVKTFDVDNNLIASSANESVDQTGLMELNNPALAEARLVDDYGNTPTWCHISNISEQTITVKCTENGLRAPRKAYIYIAFVVIIDDEMRFVNFRVTITQPSYFEYANNQHLVHTGGYSGDPMVNGMQQVHENKRILYYYPDQNVELPIRERGFYGWWRWYREGLDEYDNNVSDADVPDSLWRSRPINSGKFDFPYRTIGDSVWIDESNHALGKKLVTMGRYTVFHYPARDYQKNNPPANSPWVAPPLNKKTLKYVADISNYYDNLPLSMSHINEVDTAALEDALTITEPTLSLREIFELHPWTEMAANLENYKDTIDSPRRSQKYLEDHEVFAPIGHTLLLRTEQRYNYDHLKKHGHSESLLGYYMRDDNWDKLGWNDARKDTMIWCGGWDAQCKWYTYNPTTGVYTLCNHTVTEEEDFLKVPARAGISAGKDADTVYYCLRSRSKKTTTMGTSGSLDPATPADGDYWFNICRYVVIYTDTLKYGPMLEKNVGGVKKAIITNDEIEQTYEVLERLDFDYNKPGSDYTVYPHPLPWADASYGYSYPKSPAIPDNRHHNKFAPNFPGSGEYGLVNRIVPRIPGEDFYWHDVEQHGGAANGYMIYCDGMSSAGQVAALTLNKKLCEGQRMYFSGYVGNPSSQNNKSNPNFHFSVQGSMDGEEWEDITSYTTGDIMPSKQWYQIFFPINQKKNYAHFRVRIYNVASSFDGNDFILDDMCIFATKPPLIAYQASSTCIEHGENDSVTHVVVRVDYQGFTDESYKGERIYYTVQKGKKGDTTYVHLIDGYLNQEEEDGAIYGSVQMPEHTYNPEFADSIFSNLTLLRDTFEATLKKKETIPATVLFNQGYIYENLDGDVRPVMYIIHKAKMTADYNYKVRMSLSFEDLQSSICAMTSDLKVSNRMSLELNGEERENMENADLCANTTYDIGLRVKGTLFRDSLAPMELNGTCMNDWLLYGDTLDATSEVRYGYKYSDIVKVIKEILRCDPESGTNSNQFAPDLASVNHNEMLNVQKNRNIQIDGTSTPVPGSKYDPYVILTHLVDTARVLNLYQSKMTSNVVSGDSLQYVIFPIVGTGSDEVRNANVEVCPAPIFVKLKPVPGQGVPMSIGGLLRDSVDMNQPIVILVDSATAASQLVIHIDNLMPTRAIHSVSLFTTDDPAYRDGVHTLALVPDRTYNLTSGSDNSTYYRSGDDLRLTFDPGNNYRMRPGYTYTYNITMMTHTGRLEDEGCPVGTIPFTVAVVPYQLRWDPQTAGNSQWNNPYNWIGVNARNVPIHDKARFAPLATTSVIIPTLTDGRMYPVLADQTVENFPDSIKQVGFQYNQCKAIRFMPGSALGQQELLDYDDVVADMSMPQNKWAMRSSPVKGFFSGDVFMAEADLNETSTPWEVGEFDASGRNNKTGNASFWMSLYSRATTQRGNGNEVADSARSAAADWTRVTNGLSLELPPSQGWAVYARTKSGKDAIVRLPKSDTKYNYFTVSGTKMDSIYDNIVRGDGAGKLAFEPVAGVAAFTLTNAESSTLFVFGNPTMAYIDIWGFVHDNSLVEEIDFLNAEGRYVTVTKAYAEATDNVITNRNRYLPPMHAMVVKVGSPLTNKAVNLNSARVVTSPTQIVRPLAAPGRNAHGRQKGIMTVTAINPASDICNSRLLLGQGYSDAVVEGEDAVLTTVNVDNFSSSTPATPFNLYAVKDGCGLSIDLLDDVVNVPISFYNSDLPFEPVSYLWFTGVNNIDGTLVLYDALTGSERQILDGICLAIETPETSHETRYYIRRPGWSADQENPIVTEVGTTPSYEEEKAVKIIHNGHVFILRNGHVYTMFGQKLR